MLNPCTRESKALAGRFLREKLISDHGLFSSYEGQQRAANGLNSWDFFRNAQSFGRLDADSDDSFTSLRPPPPRYFNFPYLCMMCGLEKLGLVD